MWTLPLSRNGKSGEGPSRTASSRWAIFIAMAVLSAGAPSAASIIGALTQVPHRHRSLTQNFLPPYSVAPLLQWVRLARWPETAENGAVFLKRALLKGKELHGLET